MVIKSYGYNVIIGKNALKAVSAFVAEQKYSSICILCDNNTIQFCLPPLMIACKNLSGAEIIEIEDGETSKSIEISSQIIKTLIEQHADKNSLIINLGGGVVSDLGGFCASIYKRGIDFVNIPTSLLGMADASVGGKTGIDFGGIKNVIGNFAQPKAVFVYPDFLSTLPKRHFKNGLAEILKIALVSDKKFWNALKRHQDMDQELLIAKSIGLKNKIVLRDPFDKGLRKKLNFGHTLGHAIESLLLGTDEELLHGEAITVGMLMESHLAYQKNLISKNEFSEICTVLLLLIKRPGKINLSVEAILSQMKHDKKITKNQFRFSLPEKIGFCNYDAVATDLQIKKAILYYNTRLIDSSL